MGYEWVNSVFLLLMLHWLIASGYPGSFNSGANAAPVSVQALPVECHYSAGTDVGRIVALKQPAIEC